MTGPVVAVRPTVAVFADWLLDGWAWHQRCGVWMVARVVETRVYWCPGCGLARQAMFADAAAWGLFARAHPVLSGGVRDSAPCRRAVMGPLVESVMFGERGQLRIGWLRAVGRAMVV